MLRIIEVDIIARIAEEEDLNSYFIKAIDAVLRSMISIRMIIFLLALKIKSVSKLAFTLEILNQVATSLIPDQSFLQSYLEEGALIFIASYHNFFLSLVLSILPFLTGCYNLHSTDELSGATLPTVLIIHTFNILFI